MSDCVPFLSFYSSLLSNVVFLSLGGLTCRLIASLLLSYYPSLLSNVVFLSSNEIFCRLSASLFLSFYPALLSNVVFVVLWTLLSSDGIPSHVRLTRLPVSLLSPVHQFVSLIVMWYFLCLLFSSHRPILLSSPCISCRLPSSHISYCFPLSSVSLSCPCLSCRLPLSPCHLPVSPVVSV